MYSGKVLADRIRATCKTQGIKIGDLQATCDISINAISQVAQGRAMRADTLTAIADLLGVSVDYLLGRTDKPEINR